METLFEHGVVTSHLEEHLGRASTTNRFSHNYHAEITGKMTKKKSKLPRQSQNLLIDLRCISNTAEPPLTPNFWEDDSYFKEMPTEADMNIYIRWLKN